MISRRRALSAVGGVVLLGFVVLFSVFAAPQVVGMDASYVVLSSSMSPTIPAGSMILVNDVPPGAVAQGDVITYESVGGDEESATGPGRVTHRVVEVVERNGTRHFRTKGDANEDPDPSLVAPENVVGRVALHVPLVGRIIQFVNSDAGIIGLVVLPAVLLALNEVYTLYRAASAGDPESESESDGGGDVREDERGDGE